MMMTKMILILMKELSKQFETFHLLSHPKSPEPSIESYTGPLPPLTITSVSNQSPDFQICRSFLERMVNLLLVGSRSTKLSGNAVWDPRKSPHNSSSKAWNSFSLWNITELQSGIRVGKCVDNPVHQIIVMLR
jgi:hypothetical protein